MMMQSLINAGLRLADALDAENEALSRFDMVSAAKLAEAKIRASEAFAAAHGAVNRTASKPDTTERVAAEALSTRLKALSDENRRLLERAIALQARVIETIATAAIPHSRPATYGRGGYNASSRLTPSLALATRA